ncbi:15713_t:CDS:2, partial [Dentiscutata erythropus]
TEHQTFINLIETTQKTHSYVQFGVYVENYAKKLKWYEVLNSILYEPLELVNAKTRILNLQFMNVNETVQTISKAFSKVALSSNDLLLSGILDIESLNTLNSPIKEALRTKKLWSAVKEDLKIKPLPEGLKEFIINYVNTNNASISAPFDNNLLYKTCSLIDAIKKLWRIPKLQSCFAKYNESSWSHNVLQPIVNFITDYKEADLCIRWDSVQSKASLERNNSIGPIKKPDIYGIIESETHSDLELLLGEISNGPFNKSPEAQKHMKEDKIKLSKCGKDALDYIMRKYMKSQSNNLEKLNVFLLHAHGTFLEFFIIDKKIAPFSRLRKLETLEIPFN